MPKVAQADLQLDWQQLLTAAQPYAEVKDLKDELALLQTSYDRLLQLSSLRDEMRAKAQRATQEMGEVKEEGKDAAMRVRSVLQGILGVRNERLVEFNVAPHRLRRRRRRSKPAQASSPAVPPSK